MELEFEKRWDACKGKKGEALETCHVDVRLDYRRYLSGRYSDMGAKVHRFISLADSKNLNKHKHQRIIDIAREYGKIEVWRWEKDWK